jgi:replication initiator protein
MSRLGRARRDDLAFVARSADLWGDADDSDVTYQARVFAQTSLPYRDPGSVAAWGRRNGSLSLVVQPGYDVDRDGLPVPVGFPYGVIPRLLLSWISTEVVRTREQVLLLGESLSEFMCELGLVPTGGKMGSITRLREQIRRLFKASIAVRYSGDSSDVGIARDASRQTLIASEYELWWSAKGVANQPVLIPSYVRLTQEFFEEVITRPVPLNLTALRLLSGSPMRLDLYTWLTYRMSYLRRPTVVPWESLLFQFGSSASTKQARYKFRSDLTEHLCRVLVVYREARVEVDERGVLLRPSPPHVGRGSRPTLR